MPGNQVKRWDIYEALRRDHPGMSKEMAARIANSRRNRMDPDEGRMDVMPATKKKKKKKKGLPFKNQVQTVREHSPAEMASMMEMLPPKRKSKKKPVGKPTMKRVPAMY